jgi:hypothetical protein
MKNYEITFAAPNGDWTWIYVHAVDFHDALLLALQCCPRGCRVHGVLFLTQEQVDANMKAAEARFYIQERPSRRVRP